MAYDKSMLPFDEIYKIIANRLWNRHEIKIYNHIDKVIKVGTKLGQGIIFRPHDYMRLKAELKYPGFARDNRRSLVDSIAALATKGEGYRETTVPSLHCQISASWCNIHLDSYGFVVVGPDGKKYYNPDLVQHIVDELGFAWVVEQVTKVDPGLGKFLGKVHPYLPNSRNRYDLSYGAQIDLLKNKRWSLGFNATKSFTTGEKKGVLNFVGTF